MVHIHLVRHGEVDYSLADSFDPIYRGARADFAPLTETGIAQIRATAAGLALDNPLIVASPFTRTMQSAAVIARHFGCEFSVDLGLHDALLVRSGDVGYSYAESAALMREYQTARLTGTVPETRSWESDADIRARLLAAIRRHWADGPMVLVTHEAVIRVATGVEDIGLASAHTMELPDLSVV